MPGWVTTGVVAGAETGAGEGVGVVKTGAEAGEAAEVALAGGSELSGAPTGISQRWPGSPCGGFIPAGVAVPEFASGVAAL